MFKTGFPRGWSTMKKLIWLKRAVLSAASAILKTVSGLAPLLLGNAVAKPIHSLTQYGKCTQSGTPTPDAPVDIVCNNGAIKYSANMANVNEQTARVGYYINAQGQVLADIYNWFYQAYIPVKPNTSYTLSMSSPVYYVTISEYSTADDSGFIVRKTGSTGGNTSLTITTGANTNFVRFGTNLNRVVVTLEMVLAINWMLNIGGTAMDYQPYVEGGIYTDGTPEVLTVGGKQVWNETWRVGTWGVSLKTVQKVFANDRIASKDFIDVKPNTTYTLSVDDETYNGGFYIVGAHTLEGEDGITVVQSNSGKSATFTTSATTNFIGFALRPVYGTSYQSNVILELGSTATDYEPYVAPQTVSVPMLLGVGNYKDAAELISGLMTHKIGVLIFDGTEDWRASSSGGNIYILNSAIAVGLTAICTHFKKVSNTTSSTNMPDGSFRGHPSTAILYFKDVSAGNVADFKAYLAEQYAAGTPVIMLYALAEETTEQGTAQHLHTNEGTNVVDVTSNVDPVELAAEYYATE